MSEGTELEDEVREALRELVTEVGAVSARITQDEPLRGLPPAEAPLGLRPAGDPSPSVVGSPSGIPARTIALGGGEYLRIELGTTSNADMPIEAAFERATRQLRAIRRRWEAARLPEVVVSRNTPPQADKVGERIASYLKALAAIDRASNAFVVRAGKLISSATPPDELETSRWQFLARRAANTKEPGSSYGEIVDPDAYAMTFWYDCTLIVFLAEPYGIDFVRHRCRQVARELANLLPLLEPDPDAPAAIRRRPPTIPG